MSSPLATEILLTGGSGQVGTEFIRLAPASWNVVAPGRADLDLSSPDAIEELVMSRPWAAVVNCAAFTAVDRAEEEVVEAWRINALAPAALARATGREGIPLIHVSTDYVFDGSKCAPYTENDPVAPLGVYGASKEGGEQAVRTANPRHLILRTAWVVSTHGANFVKTMLRLAESRPELGVVNDQHGCPTSASDIAAALLEIVRRMTEEAHAPTGTYHFVNKGEATWFEFAKAIFEVSGRAGCAAPKVVPISTAEYPMSAQRPANSRLDTRKLERDYGISPRPWHVALEEIMASLLAAQKQ